MAGHLLLAKILSDISHYTNNILVVIVVLGSQKIRYFPFSWQYQKEVVNLRKNKMTTPTDVFMMTWGTSFAIILFSIFKRIIYFQNMINGSNSIFLNLLSLQQWVSVTTVVGKMMVKVGIGNSSSIVIVFAFSFAFHFRSARWWNKNYWQLGVSTRHMNSAFDKNKAENRNFVGLQEIFSCSNK